jgi:nucleotide-binding universal stress UspA family protein
MYKKIMVAVDGSETSQAALKEAENIANSYNAALCIVHSVTSNDDAYKQAGVAILKAAESSVDALEIETRMLQADAEFGSNSIADVIAKAAAEWSADLLVLGTANRRGLERFVVGSVAEQLVAKVEASILLVRPAS